MWYDLLMAASTRSTKCAPTNPGRFSGSVVRSGLDRRRLRGGSISIQFMAEAIKASLVEIDVLVALGWLADRPAVLRGCSGSVKPSLGTYDSDHFRPAPRMSAPDGHTSFRQRQSSRRGKAERRESMMHLPGQVRFRWQCRTSVSQIFYWPEMA